MAPGRRKHIHVPDYKQPSSSYVHPSLLKTQVPVPITPTIDPSASVSERIQFLRRVQQPPASVADKQQGLSQIRINSVLNGPSTSTISGPPAPLSWREGNRAGDDSDRVRPVKWSPLRVDYFPEYRGPPHTSLLHFTLKALATNLNWHLEYDHVYLSTLPIEIRIMLLSYVASYGPIGGISSLGLRTLFASPEESELSDTIDSRDIDRLDLGGSIGHFETLTKLEKIWHLKLGPRTQSTQTDTLPDSWDTAIPRTLDSGLRFPNLTKLSLANPGSQTSWMDLLNFSSKHLGQLTHLSLAGWPMPHFSAAFPTDVRTINSVDEVEADEAIHILHLLARETASLTYLCLAECHGWYKILKHIPQPAPSVPRSRVRRRGAIEDYDVALAESMSMGYPNSSNQPVMSLWSTAWKHLRTLDLSQAEQPPKLEQGALKALYDQRQFKRGMLQTHRARMEMNGLERRGEAYTVIGPIDVVEDIAERQKRQLWVKQEVEALELGSFVKAWRVRSGLKIVVVEHGWGEELLEKQLDL